MGFLFYFLLISSFFSFPLFSHSTFAEAPDLSKDIGIEEHLGSSISLDLLFKDEGGKEVSLGRYFQTGKPVLLSLVYYQCPHLCQYLLNGLVRSLQPFDWKIGDRYEIITVSIEPKETFELASQKKASYIQMYGHEGAALGWHFLTGSQASIQQLAKEVGFRYRWDEGQQQYAHAAATFVLTPQGRISRILYGIEHSIQTLKLAILEASDGKIGTVIDRLVLFCFQYDPVTRRYSVALMRLLQLGAIMTIFAIGVYLTFIVRQKQRKGT